MLMQSVISITQVVHLHLVILVSGSSKGSHAADTCVSSRWQTTSSCIRVCSADIQS